jgi:hypothetical protein
VTTTIGNRAYRALADVLGFGGVAGLAAIDAEQAIPVHGLDAIVQSSLVDRWELQRETSSAGVGSSEVNLDPFEDGVGATYTAVARNGISLGAQAGPVPRDHVFLVTRLAVSWLNTGSFTSGMFFGVPGPGATTTQPRIPFTSVLDTDITPAGAATSVMLVPTSGEPYYLQPMPIALFVDSGRLNMSLFEQRIWAGASDWTDIVSGISAPRGVLRYL